MSITQQLADLKNSLAVEEIKAAPDSLPNTTSHGTPILGGPTQPSLDTDKFDDFGHAKDETEVAMGPRGPHRPDDSMSAEERDVRAKAAIDKEKAMYSSTAGHDSSGNQKGSFETSAQGHDKHGMRIPDKVDYFKPVEPPAVHGPRGKNIPKDCFTE